MRKLIFFIFSLCVSLSAMAHDFESGGIYYNITSETDKTVEVTHGNSKYSGDIAIPSSVTYSGTTYSVSRIGDFAFSHTGFVATSVVSTLAYGSACDIKGWVVATASNGFVVADKSGAIFVYKAAASTDCVIGKQVQVTGTVSSYNKGFEVDGASATITYFEQDTYSYPTATVVDGAAMDAALTRTTDELAQYVQIDGTLSILGTYYNLAVTGATNQGSIYYANDAIKAKLENGKSYRLKGYFMAISGGGKYYNIIVTDVENISNLKSTNSVSLLNENRNEKDCNSVETQALNTDAELTSVTIPNSVTSIGNSAFKNCSGLTSVTIPNSVTSIGADAFYGCACRQIFDNLYYVDNCLVGMVDKNATSVSIKDGTRLICNNAFDGCSGLTSVTIPNSVTSIGSSAFYGCSGLTSVTIPNSVTSIGDYAFYGCYGLTSVTIDSQEIAGKTYSSSSTIDKLFGSQVKEYVIGNSVKSIGNHAFENCTGLKSVTIPNSVTSIGEYTFYKCSGLTSVTIPNSVTSIGGSAFEGCRGLTSVTIPNSVKNIGDRAFYGCSGLKSVTIDSQEIVGKTKIYMIFGSQVKEYVIGNSVTSIGASAFYDCYGLTWVTIPNSVTSIGKEAFNNSGLTSITIPNSVTSLGDYAFGYCSGLTSVTIPNSVTSIGGNAFGNCSGLTSVTVEAGNPNYDSRDNCNAIIETATNTLITGCMNTKIPNSVTSIGGSAFSGCSGLTSVTIPNSVTSIGDWAFYECSGLTSVTIPNSVTSIGGYAFYGCSGLTSVTIPNSVTSIGYVAFYGCTSLPVENNVRYADTYLVEMVDKTATSVTIKDGTRYIGSRAFKDCTSLTSVTIPNSVTSIGDYAFGDAFFGCSGLASVTIGNSVTSIGDYAFCKCSGLTSVTIGNSVTSIGEYAFYGCTSLPVENNVRYADTYLVEMVDKTATSVTIKDGTRYIGSRAFNVCTNLTSVTIPNSVASIGNYAFYECSGLTSVTIGNGVTSISESAFSGCSGLTSVRIDNQAIVGQNFSSSSTIANIFGSQVKEYVIGNSVTYIGEYAFYECSGLTSVTIPNSVTSIGDYAFYGCYGLPIENNIRYADTYLVEIDDKTATSVTIKDGTRFIGNNAFENCSGLTSVIIPNSVTSIGNSAFSGCSGLTSVTIPNSVTSIGNEAFNGCSNLTAVAIESQDIVGKAYTSSSTIADIFGAQVKEYVIGNEVKSIGEYAFANCSKLKSVTFGNSVTSIGTRAFDGCELRTVRSNASTPPELESVYVFTDDTYNNATLYTIEGLSEDYRHAYGWRKFYYIDDSGVEGMKMNSNDAVPVGYYDLNGVRYAEPQQGVNIVRYSDGTTKKVIVK